jgi:hypothetical protein
VNGRTTYGDLTRDTTHALAVAHARLLTTSFPSQAAALRAIDAYRDVAAALGTLGWRLVLGPERRTMLPGPDAVPEALQPSARLCDVLSSVGRPRPWPERKPRVVEPLVDAWGRAAVFARTAQDLLAAYWDPGGAQQTPASEQLERPEARRGGMSQIADHAGLLAEAASTLALKAVQAGFPTDQAMLLDEGGRALRRAVDEHHLDARRTGSSPDRLVDLEVARPAVRTGDPLTELGDRVARLHRFAWQLTTEPHVGVATLTNYAAAGHLLAKAAGRAIAGMAEAAGPSPAGATSSLLKHLEGTSVQWYSTYRQLQPLRSPIPGSAGVRRDLVATRELLERLTGDDRDAAAAAPVLLRGSEAFRDVARWNRYVLEAQTAAGAVLIAAHDLPRDLLSDDRSLAHSNLTGRAAVVPASLVDAVMRSYRLLDQSALSVGRGSTPAPVAAADRTHPVPP